MPFLFRFLISNFEIRNSKLPLQRSVGNAEMPSASAWERPTLVQRGKCRGSFPQLAMDVAVAGIEPQIG